MSMTEEDVKRLVAEGLQGNRDMTQWLVRAAYEEAWRAAGGSQEQSPHNELPKGWRDSWMKSSVRNILVRNGMISGGDAWK